MKIVDRYPVDLVQLPPQSLDQRHLALAPSLAAGIEITCALGHFLQGPLSPQVALPSALARTL